MSGEAPAGGLHPDTGRVIERRGRVTFDLIPAAPGDPGGLVHYPACDCREAEWAEQLDEYRAERLAMTRAAARLLVGHRLMDYGDSALRRQVQQIDQEMYWRFIRGDGPLACQCTGCQLARAGELSVLVDEQGIVTAGLSGEES